MPHTRSRRSLAVATFRVHFEEQPNVTKSIAHVRTHPQRANEFVNCEHKMLPTGGRGEPS